MQTVIVGCGYLGRRVAERWLAAGHSVTALTRSSDRAQEWRQVGLRPNVGDVLDPDSLRELPACDVLLHAVGYDQAAGVDKHRVFVEGLQNVLAACGDRVGRFVYISSSSVYGQDQGEWVDESSPTEPQTEGGRICLAAEDALLQSELSRSGRAIILRLTGLYGPDRMLTRLDALRAGTALAGSPQAWLNLIHVDDAAQAVVLAAQSESMPGVSLVTDDQPVTRGDYYSELAARVGVPPPVFDPTQLPRHGSGLNKRCSNRRIKASLGVAWRYPTYREGLANGLGTNVPPGPEQ